ncbi:MAG: hypothetical protein ABGX04_03955 [Myxococcales bacterium]|nr:hypothetical protein [Myxococcales bacterium]HIK84632.1 hypothetical protein [Myxococcales bacterium]
MVSTASISVRSLDHAGIYDALVYVGERAAHRLVAKLDLLPNHGPTGELHGEQRPDDSARRKLYDQA